MQFFKIKKYKIYYFIPLFIFLFSCNKVIIEITNQSGQMLNLKLKKGNKKIPNELHEENFLGQLDTMQKYYYSKRVSKNTRLSFYGQIVNGGITPSCFYDVNQLSSDTNKCFLKSSKILVDDRVAIDIIRQQLLEFGPPEKYENLNSINGLKTVLGSIRVYDSSGTIIADYPSSLINTAMPQIPYPGTYNKTITQVLTRNADFNVLGNIPVFLNINSHFTNSDIIKFELKIMNAGIIKWEPQQEKTILEIVQGFPPQDLDFLIKLINKYPSFKVLFINKANFIQNISLRSYKFKKIESQSELKTFYVGLSSNYEATNELNNEETINNIMTNAWGYDISEHIKYLALESKLSVFHKDNNIDIEYIYQLTKNLYPDLPDYKNPKQANEVIQKTFIQQKSIINETIPDEINISNKYIRPQFYISIDSLSFDTGEKKFPGDYIINENNTLQLVDSVFIINTTSSSIEIVGKIFNPYDTDCIFMCELFNSDDTLLKLPFYTGTVKEIHTGKYSFNVKIDYLKQDIAYSLAISSIPAKSNNPPFSSYNAFMPKYISFILKDKK